jgi:hypothetical protein
VVVEGLGVGADHDPQRAEQGDDQKRGGDQLGRVVHRDAGQRDRDRQQAGADQQRAEDAADRQPQVHLPGVDGGRQDVVDVAVGARLEDRAGVVGVGGLRHRHRDQPGDDELAVRKALDLADPRGEREAEDEDEERRGDHGRERRLRPELQNPQHLSGRQPQEAAPRLRPGRRLRVVGGAHSGAPSRSSARATVRR